MKINELLDQVKNANGLESDGELARKLGVDKRRVSDYRKGERVPDEFACLRIAEALGKPLDTIIATVKAATEKDETRREVWENYMKRLGGLAASFFVVFTLSPHVEKAIQLALLSPWHSVEYRDCFVQVARR